MQVPIDDVTSLADSTPEDAAKNIDNANLFSVDPSNYKDFKPELDEEVTKMERPKTAEPAVARYMAQSTEHAALASPDSGVLDYMERQMKLIWDHVSDRPTADRKVVDLSLKKMNMPEAWSDEDQFNLDMANEDQRTISARNYGIDGPFEQLPAQIIGGATEFVKTNLVGALEGLAKFKPKSASGVGLAAGAGILKQSYDAMVGATYNELSNAVDENGQPKLIDEQTKANISRGVGVVSAAANSAVGAALMQTTPFLAKFLRPSVGKIIVENPTLAAAITSIGQTIAAAGIGSAASVASEASRIVGEEMGLNYDGSEASFTNALYSSAEKLSQPGPYRDRLTSSALVGAGVTGLLAGAGNVAGFKATKNRYQTLQQANEQVRVNLSRDVTPAAPKELSAASSEQPSNVTPLNPPPPSGSDLSAIQSVKVLQFKQAMEGVTKAAKSTKMMEISPSQLAEFKKMAFENAGVKRLFLAKDDLVKWATDEKKIEAAANLIDPSGVAAAQMNAAIAVEPHKLATLAMEYPELWDLTRIQADGPSPIQASEFLEKLKKAEGQREQVLQKLGITPEDLTPIESNVKPLPESKFPPLSPEDTEALVRRAEELSQMMKAEIITKEETAAFTKELEAIKERIKATYQMGEPGKLLIADWGPSMEDVAGQREVEFLNEPTYTEAIKSVVPENEVKKFSDAILKGRESIKADIDEAAKYEMIKVLDVEMEYALEVQRQIEEERIANNPNFAIVDKFLREVIVNEKGKKPVSIYAIDPSTLTDAQILRYSSDPQLKEHGVFVKGGLTPEQSAKDIGVSDGDEFLRIMSMTPSRDKVVKARLLANEADIAQQVLDSVDLNHTNIVKSYDNKTGNALRLMKFMKDKEWTTTKKAIKRIALPLPTIEELQVKARNMIMKTKVGDLNVNQYRVGERQSQKIAVNAILKIEPEKAFLASENQALNIQMQKSSAIAISKVNRVIKFAKVFNDKSVMRELENAGETSVNAANELLDVFNLNPSRKNISIAESYQKWVKKTYEAGRGDFGLNPELTDVRQSVNDMTVESLLAVGDRLRAVLHDARMSNKLFNEFRKEVLIQTEDAIAAEVDKLAKAHPSYDGSRVPSVQDTKPFMELVRKTFGDMRSLIANAEHILKELDVEQYGGFFKELIWDPLKGDGKFDKKSGVSLEFEYIKALKEASDKRIEAYGRDDYKRLDSKILDIPEFKNSKALNRGKLTKADLMTMWAYKGDPDGVATLAKNHGVSIEVIQRVLDRELEERDVTLVQNLLVNPYKTYREATTKLQKETTGQDVTFIQGVPNRWRDKVFSGGYFPNKYKFEFTKQSAKETLEKLKEKPSDFFQGPNGEYVARQRAAEMTEQGRLIERVGSNRPLDLSFTRALRGHEEVIHDLSYRKALMDTLKILKNDSIAENIIGMVGHNKFGVLVNTVIEMANRIEADNANYFSDQNRFIKNMVGRLQSNFSVGVLMLNPISTIIQYSSIGQVLLNMGKTGPKYLAKANYILGKNPKEWYGFYKFFSGLDPTIGHFIEGVQNNISSNIHDIAPKKSSIPGTLGLAQSFHKWSVNVGMAPMALADIHLKIQGAAAAYMQFMGGDVEGYSLERIAGMSDAEKYEKAQAHVRQMSRTSLTHGRTEDRAPLQKFQLGALLTNYWNDPRNTINNELSVGRKIKYQSKKAKQQVKDGDYEGAAKSARNIGAYAAGIVVIASLTRFLNDYLHNRDTPADEDFDLKSAQGIRDATERMVTYALSSPVDEIIETLPGVRDVNYAAFKRKQKSEVKNFEVPIGSIADDVATSAAAMAEFLFIHRDLEGLSDRQIRALMNSFSVFAVPIPVNAYFKLQKRLAEKEDFNIVTEPPRRLPVKGDIEQLRDEIKDYKKNPPAGASNKFMEELDQLEARVTPKTAAEPPANASDIMKYAASGGDWTKKDPNSSAAGLYQFTETAWRDVMKRAPELGLTENGRVSKDGFEQSMAMEWSNKYNAERLGSQNVPVDLKSLFGSHLLGVDNYIKLFKAPADTKLKTVIGVNSQFDFKTVGQMKEFIDQRIVEGKNLYNKLTLTSGKTED